MRDRLTGSEPVQTRRQRSGPRLNAAVTLVVSTEPSGRVKATLTDISEQGCHLRIEDGLLGLGQIVVLRMCVCDDVRGVIRWVRDEEAGLEFLKPLARPLVDLIGTGKTP